MSVECGFAAHCMYAVWIIFVNWNMKSLKNRVMIVYLYVGESYKKRRTLKLFVHARRGGLEREEEQSTYRMPPCEPVL